MKTVFPNTVKILADQINEARIDHLAFDIKLRPCEIKQCRATCCHDGVHLSAEEASYIDQLVQTSDDQFKSYGIKLDDAFILASEKGYKTATRTALAEELAVDYPAHFPKTRCVFLDHNGYCGLQRLGMEQGGYPWKHKPLTCWLHPLVLVPAGKWEARPVLTILNSVNDTQKSNDYPGFASCTHCGREDSAGELAWKVLKKELTYLGELCNRDIYGELSAEPVDWELE